jgi:hypothetical protein
VYAAPANACCQAQEQKERTNGAQAQGWKRLTSFRRDGRMPACMRALVRYYSVADEKGEETSRSQADLWDQLTEARSESRSVHARVLCVYVYVCVCVCVCVFARVLRILLRAGLA